MSDVVSCDRWPGVGVDACSGLGDMMEYRSRYQGYLTQTDRESAINNIISFKETWG
jgi:hypothetical protein